MDFPYDYMRMLLAKEIDVAAELQKQKSQVVRCIVATIVQV